MTTLAAMAVGIGLAAIIGKGMGLVMPEKARGFVKAFPRSRLWAWLLTALDLVLVSLLLWNLPNSWFTPWRPVLFVAGPVAFLLVIKFADELLSVRALGGLLLLAAAPVLDAARFHPSQARLVLVFLAYAWVFPGMLLVSNPWWFRKLTGRMMASDARCRAASAVGMLIGVVLVVLGLWVY
ncbi:MAG: hypothetical protein R6X19_01320 [Kiritimatiellia bacterium]